MAHRAIRYFKIDFDTPLYSGAQSIQIHIKFEYFIHSKLIKIHCSLI